MHIVYILRSLKDSGRFYTGRTTNLPLRLSQHNEGKSPVTAAFRPWELGVAIHFIDAPKAEAFERTLKSGSGRAFARRHF
jgi:predicted GIY-YIG superfamily endonuclease